MTNPPVASYETPAMPDYTLRRRYTKRPSHVLKLRLRDPAPPSLALPEDDAQRMWTLLDEANVVIKTWHFQPLPDIVHIFKDTVFDNISIEFNIGPHEQDSEILEGISTLNSTYFSLEFREHWAGLPSEKNEVTKKDSQEICEQNVCSKQDEEPEQVQQASQQQPVINSYSDKFLKPFVENEAVRRKIKILTGRVSAPLIRALPSLTNLKFLGLRLSHEEYLSFSHVAPQFHSLERIHILPQWEFDANLPVPPIRFLGVVTIYYWDVETTKMVKKSYSKWRKNQSKKKRKKFFCL